MGKANIRNSLLTTTPFHIEKNMQEDPDQGAKRLDLSSPTIFLPRWL